MALDIIGAGYGRTGTESLRSALEMLGFGPCHHMHAIRDTPALLPVWQEFADGKHRDWDRLFDGFRSQVDFPGAAYWRDLIAHYPKARVILTIRDPEKWYDSVLASVLELMAERETLSNPHHRAVLDLSDRLVGEGYFGGRGPDRDHMIARFQQHTQNVIDTVPADRLLVYQVAEGWGPLCAFLDVPVPDAPFPHANDAASYRDHWDGPSPG
ncbi:sulfotransferase family protein [Marivivens marinus]|uniref:sulfotransferase family protein n=1 Tax=Marivivens marinus TaxID=3110173 RepID=UPI003B84ACE3